MIIGIIGIILFFVFYLLNKNNFSKNEELQKNNVSKVKIKDKVINNKKSDFKTALNFGVFLIIISSIIFATTTWNFINDISKVLILFFETFLFFALGIILKRIFKVEKTSYALTFISSILIGVTVLSMGYFGIFGSSFSTFGSLKMLFYSLIFAIELFIFFIRKKLKIDKRHSIILTFLMLFIFSLTNFVTDSIYFSISMVLFALFAINLLKDKIFKNIFEFNIFNAILTILISLLFIFDCIYLRKDLGVFEYQNLYLFFILMLMNLNIIYSTNKINSVLKNFSIIYCGFLVIWFGIFSSSLITSCFVFSIFSILSYFWYYVTDDNQSGLILLIISYLFGFISVILFYFSNNYLIFSTFISIIFLFLSLISSIKNKELRIFNYIIRPLFLILLVISLILQPKTIINIKLTESLIIINVVLAFMLFLNVILKKNIKSSYLIFLMSSIFTGTVLCDKNNIWYIIVSLIINISILIYSYFSKDKFFNNCNFSISLLLIFNVIISLSNHPWSRIVFLMLVILSGYLMDKKEKRRYLYLSLFYIPLVMLINKIFPVNKTFIIDFCYTSIIPFFMIFSRKFASFNKEKDQCVFELIIFSFIMLMINSDIFKIIFLSIIYLICYIFNCKKNKSGYMYNNYLLFLTPIIFISLGSEYISILYKLFTICLMIINQILAKCFIKKRSYYLEVTHAILSLILLCILIENLNFNGIFSFLISSIFLLINYFIYIDKRLNYFIISFIIYPLHFLIKSIFHGVILEILNIFIWIIPIIIIVRKILNIKDKNAEKIEFIVLAFMYLNYMFIIHFNVAITLGILSILFIIIGNIFKFKSLSYIGYISLLLNVIIQTSFLWRKVPWWLYLMIVGVILVIYATIKESKKK